jgi:hypothetical protein
MDRGIIRVKFLPLKGLTKEQVFAILPWEVSIWQK